VECVEERNNMIKQHIYKNISSKVVHAILPSKDFKTAEDIFVYPDTIKELEYPGLDHYVPHHLVKLEYGTGIQINPNKLTTVAVELVADEPAIAPIIEAPIVDEPAIAPIIEAPIADEPVVETPIVVEPVVEAPIVEEEIKPVVEEEVEIDEIEKTTAPDGTVTETVVKRTRKKK
jgi:hypothetical protein